MRNSDDTHNIIEMLRLAPMMFLIMAVLTLLSAIWLRSPVAYLAASIVTGVVWLVFLACGWRFRSDITTLVSTAIIISAHQLLRAWLAPHGLLTLVQGALVSGTSVMLLIWLLRRRLTNFCRLTDESHA